MRTFLNVPLLGINCTYQMSAHHSCVLAHTLMTMCPYSKQVQDIEQYGASVGDDLEWTISNISKVYTVYIDYYRRIDAWSS